MTYYLDSNVFIYPALYEGEKSTGAAALLRRIVDGEFRGATASPTLDEVIRILSRETDRRVALEQGRRILRLPNLRIVDVREREIHEGIETMERHDDLAPRDAIHLAAMRIRGIERIVSDEGTSRPWRTSNTSDWRCSRDRIGARRAFSGPGGADP